jgi:hypothetical protein
MADFRITLELRECSHADIERIVEEISQQLADDPTVGDFVALVEAKS